MKKLIVLLIVVVSLSSGCSVARALFMDPRVSAEMRLENVARSYKVTTDVVVKIIGQSKDTKVAEKVFSDFGFLVQDEEFISDPDFKILVEREDLGGGGRSNYGFGFSNNQKSLVRARLTISNKGIKKIIEDTTAYTHRTSYSDGYSSRYNYQNDPGEVAFRGALMVCIGKFIDEADIPYRKINK